SLYRTDAGATPLGGLLSYNTGNNTYSALTSTNVSANTPLDQLLIGVQQRDRSIRDSSLFNQTDLLLSLRTGRLQHHLAVGTEIGRDEYVNNYAAWYNFNFNNGAGLGANLADVFNLAAPPYSGKPSGANVFRVPGSVTTTNADTIAAYFNDQIDL